MTDDDPGQPPEPGWGTPTPPPPPSPAQQSPWYQPGPPYGPVGAKPPRTVHWAGVLVGLLGTPVLWFVGILGIANIGSGELGAVVGLGSVVAAFVLLARGDPFWRGVGIGMMIAMALAPILLIGACFVLLSDLG